MRIDLIISDTQNPFENNKALPFVAYLKKHYKIKDENCYHVGDEIDALWGGRWPKDADIPISAREEIKITKHKIQEWAAVFPKLKLCISNHGLRWVRKATAAEIPSELLREYSQIIGAPKGWIWKDQWDVAGAHPYRIIHGMGYSGKDGARNAAIDSGISTAIGHLHSHAGIANMNLGGRNIWAMNTGCLIDPESYAFAYGRESRFKPVLGCGLVFNEGRVPVFMPLEL